MPIFGISVGLTIDKELVAGIVHNPFLNETFTAIKGEGAYRNGIRIRTNDVTGKIFRWRLIYVKNFPSFLEIDKSNLNYEISLARAEKWKPLYMHRLHHLISIMEG